MLILIVIVLFLALVGTVVVFAVLLSRTKGCLFRAGQELKRANNGRANALKAARRTEVHCTELILSLKQAVANGAQVEVVSQQVAQIEAVMGQLFSYVADEPLAPARHAVHAHVNHQIGQVIAGLPVEPGHPYPLEGGPVARASLPASPPGSLPEPPPPPHPMSGSYTAPQAPQWMFVPERVAINGGERPEGG